MKIKIAILINDFFFNNYETFYKLLKEKESIFDVKVLAVDGYNDKNKNSHAISRFLKSINIDNIDTNKNNKLFNLEEYNPDYVFYLVPYDCYFKEEYSSEIVKNYSNVCTISYGASMIKNEGLYESLKNNSFFENAKYVFVETSYNLDFGSHTEKFIPIGYMKLDKYIYYNKMSSKKNKRTKILWKPRWTLDRDSNFFREIENISKFIKHHKEVDFYVYYHPLFNQKIKEKNLEKEFTKIHTDLKTYENYFECEYSTFLEDVLSSDILISDHSSTLVEFAMTGKPMIYTKSNIKLNDLGNKIISNAYVSTSSNETINYLEELLKGNDSKKEKRERCKNKYYFYPPGHESVSNYLVNYLLHDYELNKIHTLEKELAIKDEQIKKMNNNLKNKLQKLLKWGKINM